MTVANAVRRAFTPPLLVRRCWRIPHACRLADSVERAWSAHYTPPAREALIRLFVRLGRSQAEGLAYEMTDED